ncbi:MAG: ribonuclease E, partial [bacterium]
EILDRLQRPRGDGYPELSFKELLYVRNMIFNEPNAPVSYPFLWDIAQSDYVQWNGLASNAGVGPLGRNTGEVIGVFAILDWTAENPGFCLSGWVSGQKNKRKRIKFKSSINLVNLERLEAHLRSLKSPQWPEKFLAGLAITKKKAKNFSKKQQVMAGIR